MFCGRQSAPRAPTAGSLHALILFRTLGALLALLGGPPAVADGPRTGGEPPLATQLKYFDFNERPLGNYEDVPMHWAQLAGPALPAFCRGGFDDEAGRDAPPAFRLGIQGVAANIAFEYAHEDLLIQPGAEYLVSGYVKVDGLRYARAFMAGYLVDRFGERLPGSERISNFSDVTARDWQRLQMPLSADYPGAFAVRLQVWILQTAAWRTPLSDLPDPIRREDVRGAAWFDDVRVLRIPQARLALRNVSGVIPQGAECALEFSLNGAGASQTELRFFIRDSAGELRTDERFALPRRVDDRTPILLPAPELPPGRYEATVQLFVGDESVLERHCAFAVLAPLPQRPAAGAADIGLDLGTMGPASANGLQALLGELRCRHVKVHLRVIESLETWTGMADLRRLTDLLRQLAGARINAVAVLEPPVERGSSTAQSLRTYMEHVPRWRDSFSPLLAQLGGNISSWQLGAEQVENHAGGWTRAQALEAREQIQRFVSIPEIIVPAGVLPRELEADGPVSGAEIIRSVQVPPQLGNSDLVRQLEFLTYDAARQRCWLYLSPGTDPFLSPDQRMADYVRRIAIARLLEPERLFIPAPFALETSGGGPALAPDDLFLPVRTLLHFLNGSRAAGVLRLEPNAIALVYRYDERSQHGFAVAWTWQPGAEVIARAYLGPHAQLIDLLGRTSELQNEDGQSLVPLSSTPRILDNIDVAIALLQSSFTLTPDYFETHERRSRPVVRFKNYSDGRLSGAMELSGPPAWTLTPRAVEFSLEPGQEFERPVEMIVPPRQAASTHSLDVKINLQGQRSETLRFKPVVTIGLRDVGVDIIAHWEGETLLVDQSLHNLSTAVVSFGAFCDVPQRARQDSQFLEVPPGESRTRRYAFPAARALAGKRLRAGLQEIGGQRSLDQLVDIPE